MPYIRTITMQKIKHELFLFVIISIAVATFIMFLFFRSIRVILSSLLIVGISIIWVMGTMVLFGYKITILTGVIPSLIVIIVIENCIYILNKYHWEFRSHGIVAGYSPHWVCVAHDQRRNCIGFCRIYSGT